MPCPAVADDEGLLHDARNLIGALSLYCDLLSMPGVLKMEHRHYADEVRQLGARSAAMIQQLMEHSVQAQGAAACSWLSKSSKPGDVNAHPVQDTLPTGAAAAKRTESAPSPVSLRNIVERCSGLLGRVACGSAVEISFGVAAAAPVSVGEETVERILVNLVRNSAAALAKREPACAAADLNGRDDGSVLGDSAQKTVSAPRCSVHEVDADPTADETPGSIRIGVGLLANRVGDARPWPFRRVRLTVEDSGCGMAPEQLERLLAHGREPSRSSHGIGFRVVRELVAASSGDLRVMSAPGIGTRVQIEWQMVAASSTEGSEGRLEPARGLMPDRLSGYSGPPRLGGMRRMNGPLGAHRMADVRELPGTREPKTTSSQTVEPNLGATGRPSC
jgi:signal transduction histidine kinase